MPPELAQLLHHAAPEPSNPLDPEHVWRAGRRRRRHRRLTLAFSIVAVAGLAAVAVAWVDRPQPDRTITADDGIVAQDPTRGSPSNTPRPGIATLALHPHWPTQSRSSPWAPATFPAAGIPAPSSPSPPWKP